MDKEKTPIYEIYVMELPWQLDEKKFPTCGIRERVGFYYDKEDAIRAVEENWCDIQDHYAKAVEIRKIYPGLYPLSSSSEYWYYLWNPQEKKFESAKKPELEEWGCDY